MAAEKKKGGEKADGRGGPRPGSGRPKGTGTGPIGDRFAVKVSTAYRQFMAELAKEMGGTEADLFREGIRLVAEARGFRRPPLR